MYQGKFAKQKKGRQPARNTSMEELPRQAARPQQPRKVQQPQPRQADPRACQQYPAGYPQQPPVPQKKSRTGGLVFYTLFFAGIFACYVFAYGLLGNLQDWLVSFEAAQPTRKCQEVFDQNFADPDWAALYEAAGIENSAYEGKDAFAAYMEEKVGDQPLSYLETSAGMAQYTKKYVVRSGKEKVATFTLVDANKADNTTDIPDWQLGDIDLFFQGDGTYRIETLEGYTTTVNGVALDESSVIRTVSTKAGDYLPEGSVMPTACTQEISGLLAMPQVAVTDGSGNAVEVTYDEATRTFSVPAAQGEEMPEDLKERSLEAIKTYAMYMSQKGGGDEKLSKYFKRGTDTYKTISSMERTWNQTFSDHSFSDESVTDYVRYADDYFSARVSVKLHLVRGDGSEKVTEIDRSMFFKEESGIWKCVEMTAVDVSEKVEKVRLTFRNEDAVLASDMVEVGTQEITCPIVTAPEGKVFSGWMVEEVKDNGDRVMRVVLQPNEEGIAPAPQDLQPMELLPLFEDQ